MQTVLVRVGDMRRLAEGERGMRNAGPSTESENPSQPPLDHASLAAQGFAESPTSRHQAHGPDHSCRRSSA